MEFWDCCIYDFKILQFRKNTCKYRAYGFYGILVPTINIQLAGMGVIVAIFEIDWTGRCQSSINSTYQPCFWVNNITITHIQSSFGVSGIVVSWLSNASKLCIFNFFFEQPDFEKKIVVAALDICNIVIFVSV